MFSVAEQPFGSLSGLLIASGDGRSSCGCIPSWGANIHSLRLTLAGKPFDIIDGFRDERQLLSNEKSKSILLIPFPNRIKDGSYFFEGKKYCLPVNKPAEKNAIHGFIWNRAFENVAVKCGTSAASVTLENNYDGAYGGFPFPFRTRLEYELKQDEFSVSVEVFNQGVSSMPLGAGWHPYFTFHQPVDELLLRLPPSRILETDERMIPTGRKKNFLKFRQDEKIATAVFDTALEFTARSDIYRSFLTDPSSRAAICLEQSSVFGYLQVYIPPSRGSIALEPMTCPANAFNSGEGLITLKPGEKMTGRMRVRMLVNGEK